MSVVELNKISLIGMNSDREDILKELMELEAIHVIDIASREDLNQEAGKENAECIKQEISDLEEQLEKVAFALKQLSIYDKRKKKLFEARREVNRENYEKILTGHEAIWDIVNGVAQHDKYMAHLNIEKNKYGNRVEYLNPWETLDIPLEVSATQATHILTGYISKRSSMEELEGKLKEQTGECCVRSVSTDHEYRYIYLIYHYAVAGEVGRVLKDYGFTKVMFSDLKGTAQENIKRALAKMKELDCEQRRSEEKMEDYAKHIDKLEVLYDYLLMNRDRKKSFSHLESTQRTFRLEGWIPAHLTQCIVDKLQNKWDCATHVQKPEPNEEYPVLLENNSVGQSVEAVTGMYSLPSPKEVDPNFITAIFFILFYGFMVGDAIYGVIMIAISTIVLFKNKLEKGMTQLFKLLRYCGFSAVFWGAMFGGWFGIPGLAEHNIWLNPLEKPEEFLQWTLLLGIIHIYVGIGVKGYNLFRKKKYLDILMDVAVWYVFFTGFVLFVLPLVFNAGTGNFEQAVTVGKYMMLSGGIIILLTQGRTNKNIFLRLSAGAAKLYEVVKFMSDVLSYSRLMALGLATSVIGSIVYEIAIMNGINNPLKIIFFVVVLALGHTLNFGIAMLSAYVHSSRLQYIEFFGRFYEGGGVPFQPLKAHKKFIKLEGGNSCGYSILGNDR